MPTSAQRPKLRPVEVIVVPDAAEGRVLLLRDTEGVAPDPVALPVSFGGILARFDGVTSTDVIAALTGAPPEVVLKLARELDEALFLDSPRYRARRREVVRAFADAHVRPATHAGGAYHGEQDRLTRFIDDTCLAVASSRTRPGRARALVSPHMDLWRAAEGYGHAYRALADALDPAADLFVLLGTSHAAMQRPFAICEKSFETPLGALEPDHDFVAALAKASRFDVREDEYLHKSEHSLEFQVVFLKHLLGARRARIVPILCGLGDAQTSRRDPSSFADAESFVEALAGLVADAGSRAVLVAGADLAHVGPRFGDAAPLDAPGRAALDETDRVSIDLALAGDASGFFRQVAADLDARRVCGLGPIYTMLRALPAGLRGERLNYSQCIDPEEGSIVSHTSIAYWQG